MRINERNQIERLDFFFFLPPGRLRVQESPRASLKSFYDTVSLLSPLFQCWVSKRILPLRQEGTRLDSETAAPPSLYRRRPIFHGSGEGEKTFRKDSLQPADSDPRRSPRPMRRPDS